ncbi:hypothetical protein F4823DRAFT_608693 [Ustulina deusta]|nr:hypothetical protein F4823DRAFT_608693 [Ustulina deusta]
MVVMAESLHRLKHQLSIVYCLLFVVCTSVHCGQDCTNGFLSFFTLFSLDIGYSWQLVWQHFSKCCGPKPPFSSLSSARQRAGLSSRCLSTQAKLSIHNTRGIRESSRNGSMKRPKPTGLSAPEVNSSKPAPGKITPSALLTSSAWPTSYHSKSMFSYPHTFGPLSPVLSVTGAPMVATYSCRDTPTLLRIKRKMRSTCSSLTS